MNQEEYRQQLINEGIKRGYTNSRVNDLLEYAGFDRDYKGNMFLKNLTRNAGEFVRDMKTFSGMAIKPSMTVGNAVIKAPFGEKRKTYLKELKKQWNDPVVRNMYKYAGAGALLGAPVGGIGALGGAFLGANVGLASQGEQGIEGLRHGAKNVADAILSTYNTSLDDIASGNFSWREAGRGAFKNPLYAGLDFAPVHGRVIAKAAKTIPLEKAPTFVRQVLPDTNLRELNRDITNSLVQSATKADRLYDGYNLLSESPMASREKIVRNIRFNEGGLNANEQAIANAIKRNFKDNEQRAIGTLLDAAQTKSNTIADYVMGKLNDDRLLHANIENYVRQQAHKISDNEFINFRKVGGTGTELDARIDALLKSDKKLRDKINKLANEGEKLYDEGKIAFLTQALTPTRDKFGRIVANEIAKTGTGYFGTRRIVGQTKVADQAKMFDKSVKYQISQFDRAFEAQELLDRITKDPRFAKEIVGVDPAKFEAPKNAVVVNPTQLQELLRDAVMEGKELDIEKFLNKSNSVQEGAFLVDKMAFNAIKNAIRAGKSGGTSKFMNTAKRAMLATPHWFVLNRVGNITNNVLEGVRGLDYAYAIRTFYNAPEALKRQTSYSSYLSTGVGKNATGGNRRFAGNLYRQANKIARAVDEFSLSEKGLGDMGKLASKLFTAFSDSASGGIFQAEAAFELLDRYANLIRQAKKEGRATGRNWKTIIEESKTDTKLFNKLNNEVNKSLGDYVGRNWQIPRGWYTGLSEFGAPFYRFLTQTARTTGRQAVHNPLGFASMTTIPARVSNPISEYVINQYNLDPDKYSGGVPYKMIDGNLRTVAMEPLPIGALTEEAYNMLSGKDWSSSISPLLSTIPEAIAYRKFDRTPTSPRLNELKETDIEAANNFQPTFGERASLLANTLLGLTFSPYKWGTQLGPEFFNSLTGRSMYSNFDTNPLIQNPKSYEKTEPSEMVGKWFGIQSRSNYPKRRQSKSKIKRNKRIQLMNKKK